MSLQEFWFVLIGVLFTGYFVLEGFDFGVGMLMPILGKGSDTRRRVVLNTIGPVWDGNEVWVITAGGAMFAAFPEWYASLFSGFYLALLLLLVALILRICAIEYRGKIDDPRWRARCDLGIGIGSWIPALAWGWVFANVVRGVPLNEKKQFAGSVWDLLGPYALLGGLTTGLLFALHGAVFLGLKTGGEVRADAQRTAKLLLVPTAVIVGVFGVWTQLAYGTGWTWIPLGLAVLGLVGAGVAVYADRDGWAFTGTAVTVAAATALLFGSLFPNVLPSTIDAAFDLTIHNASSTPYTLKVMSWAAVLVTPVVLLYQGWTYWVFRKRITVDQIPAPIGLSLKD
ncbi:cytochrome bd-type menaquinol oxidase subunit II [Nocardia brasiliensis NBRC 14402]|uniref:cytochrome d ubiquinol oxidase subunit II n=1 Tax=Nocardia brasiliensis TaxID=37326 RepID=UPI0002FCB58D|nr:cytochrome d ubiquinol oxidase subunit II [Nocardia brasiliensis]ASF10290.1 cytochrome d ubiquinol oxidase subunit II [Nocardia brasiliensis]GAJ85259.1 cytochrome bd-type menaquinol oxidase subunit II [Nocardia brasiliensis NBRC 14402]SUB11242.1 Cytochrome d ubiquinol oxidase subunit 2 [Nocardia brasiliensis]